MLQINVHINFSYSVPQFPSVYSEEGTAEVAVSQLNSNKLKKSSKFIIFPSLDSEVALPKKQTDFLQSKACKDRA